MYNVQIYSQRQGRLHCDQLQISTNQLHTVAELETYLLDLHPEWQQDLLDENLLISVNQRMVTAQHVLLAGDEVAFYTPEVWR